MGEHELMMILRYLALGMTGYKLVLPGITILSAFLMLLLADGGNFNDRIYYFWEIFNTHVIYRHRTRFELAVNLNNFWLYSCPNGVCSFNTDEAIRLFMLIIFFPSVIILYIIELAMVIASFVADGFVIYMSTLSFQWKYTLARNADVKV